MQYKIDTKELYTNKGQFVKKIECPRDVDWQNMLPEKNDIERHCIHCNKSILDIEFLTEEEVVFLLNKRPETCLKINAKKI